MDIVPRQMDGLASLIAHIGRTIIHTNILPPIFNSHFLLFLKYILVVSYFAHKDTICVYWKLNDIEDTLNTFIKYTRDREYFSYKSVEKSITRFRFIQLEADDLVWSQKVLAGVNVGCQVCIDIFECKMKN